jgi:hypothetical protein
MIVCSGTSTSVSNEKILAQADDSVSLLAEVLAVPAFATADSCLAVAMYAVASALELTFMKYRAPDEIPSLPLMPLVPLVPDVPSVPSAP